MKKIGLVAVVIGMVVNAYGMDKDTETAPNKSGRPLTDLSNHREEKESEDTFADCRQNLKAEKDEARRKGFKEGVEKGKKEGILNVRKEMALALLQMSLTDEQIIQATSLTSEQLAELKKKK